MSPSRAFLLFTLLMLVILMQVVVLRWGVGAVFFTTWLIAALTVRHDSRLSPAVGLALLATCPFLLIIENDATANLAANYAFFFLAIGVIVQLEELLLERYGWLDRRLDLSPLWRPLAQELHCQWSTAVATLERLLAIADRTELVWLVQVMGTAGLSAVFLWAVLSGARTSIVLPLLGGAILFPFVVWGLRLVLSALGPVWLLHAALALVILPLTAFELIWLYDLLNEDKLARMETVYDFADHWESAQRNSPIPAGEAIEAQVWTIEEEPRRVLYQHPAFTGASQVAYTVEIGKGCFLAFSIATAPESWEQPGDGVTFGIYVASDQGTEQIWSTYLDPKQNPEGRRWHPYRLDLSEYAGQTVKLIFQTGAGPAGDTRYDWAGWGAPRLLAP